MSHSHQPTLTSAAALRADLSTPGTKLCLREYFDGDRAHHILQAPPEVLSADHRAKLNRVLRHAKVSADSRWYLETRYDFSTTRNPAGKAQGQGRVYGDVTLGTLPTDIRNYIATGCTDLDIGNSHPTCLLHACKQAGIEAHAPCLAEYVQHCGAVLAEIKADYGLQTRAEQKEVVIKVLNGGAWPTPTAGGNRHFLQKLAQETNTIARLLMTDPRYQQEAAAARKMKGKVTFLHYLMAKLELDVLMSLAAYLHLT